MNTKAELDRLLQLRNEHPERVADIDQQIQKTFMATRTVLVLDMSGFSRLTFRYGIIHFLAMIRRLNAIALPILDHYDGKLMKQEADNLFVLFSSVETAVEAAIEILKSLTVVNTGLPDSQDLFASVGIGYGEMLIIGDKDAFGNEMNLASKLGEDLARSSEILLTEAAFQQVDSARYQWETLELTVSGIELTAYKVLFNSPLR